MLKYTIVALHDVLKTFPDDEQKVTNILNGFECASNKDVENFLKDFKIDKIYNFSIMFNDRFWSWNNLFNF